MAIIKVSIKNRDTLVLEEDAKKGDEIDLKTLFKIDNSYIEKVIEENKKELIDKKVNELKIKIESDYKIRETEFLLKQQKENQTYKSELEINHKKEINDLNNKISELTTDIQVLKKNKEQEILTEKTKIESLKDKEISKLKSQIELNNTNADKKLLEQLNEKDNLFNNETRKLENDIKDLKNQIKLLEETKQKEIENIKLQENKKTYDEINTLKTSISTLEQQKKEIIDKNLLQNDLNLKNQKLQIEDEFNKKLEKIESEKREIEEKYNQISLAKSTLNVKKLGEELEKWCNSEFEEASQYGFENTEWYKDNTAIKEENELKASKADYIFKVYSSQERNNDTLLASVCLEMKNESNVSTNTKKNSDHYAKLDKDRNKKGCEYALLVSELERDTNNDVPVRRVSGYEKMYVVRPQYMISFLSLIYALSNKYKDLINEEIKEKLELKSSTEIKDEFESFKKKYLEDQIVSFAGDIEELKKHNDEIIKRANKNEEIIEKLINTKIETMKIKIERFDIKKIVRKLEKLETK